MAAVLAFVIVLIRVRGFMVRVINIIGHGGNPRQDIG